jgi:PAS domain S-box-containing protein
LTNQNINVFETSPLGICIVENGHIQHANPALLKMSGYSLAEICRLPLNELINLTD